MKHAISSILLCSTVCLPEHAVAAESPTRENHSENLSAEIRWTSHGVPHIRASDLAGVGFGEGYAVAKQNICEIADMWITLRAERSKFFGPQTPAPSYSSRDPELTNLDSDFFWQWILDQDIVGRELRAPAPRAPTAEVREMVRGYVAGYNHYLVKTGIDKLPDPRCRGASWVRPITEKDVYLKSLHSAWYTTTVGMMPQLIAAAPPSDISSDENRKPLPSLQPTIDERSSLGSNMIALGKDATDNGRGMLFANPHWMWNGPLSFHMEVHLTVPGKLDVYGTPLLGSPFIAIGTTQGVAWSQTVNAATHSSIFRLNLVPGDPTSYFYDNKPRKMEKRVVSVEVKEADGRLTRKSHEFWTTPDGMPVLESGALPWAKDTAYVYRSAYTGIYAMNVTFKLNQAKSVSDVEAAYKQSLGVPIVNLIAADSKGDTVSILGDAIPHVTDEQLAACRIANAALNPGTLVLDGSRSSCAWGSDPDSLEPGTFGPTRLPWLRRSDYVTNSNDSYWTTNPHQLLEGFPSVMGGERTPRTLRTREGLRKIEQRLNGLDGLPGKRFTLADLESITMDNRVYSGELWRDSLVDLCRTLPATNGVAEACDVLAEWDLTENLDSQGAVLWRRFFDNLSKGAGRQIPPEFFTVPFDLRDPVNTPRGLNTHNPKVPAALIAAIADLRQANIPLNASLRAHQYVDRKGVRIPIPGGPAPAGQYNVIANQSGWTPPNGWPEVTNGSSIVMWVQFTDDGPRGRSILTNSQSSNPESPYFSDQTRLFSESGSKPIAFTDKQIIADANINIEKICIGVKCPRQ